MNQLEVLRESLGQCDEIILDALLMRNRIVEDIMVYKEANNVPILQPEQEAKQKEWLERRMQEKRHKNEVADVFESITRNSKKIQARKLFNYNIVLIGFMGAGKSTIVNLISRFYNVNGGRVLIDGQDISQVTIHSLREQMGIMMQDSFIFSGDIEDNIRYGKLDATREEIVKASRTVCADEFISKMPDRYQTEVRERGSMLSQGQKQLISFARTLLSDPAILILDEATSSIDVQTEKALQTGLNAMLKGRTSFIIAHRLSTIRNCDKIMYIDNGGIMESGTHDELMAKKGYYYKLYTAQLDEVQKAG